MVNPTELTVPQQALKDRLKAFTGGAMFALMYVPLHLELTDTKKDNISRAIEAAAKKRIENLDSILITQYHETVSDFIDTLVTLCEGHLTANDIRLGEAYYVWQATEHNGPVRKAINSVFKMKDTTIHMTEKPISPTITPATKDVFKTVLNEPAPAWFSQLTTWEQAFLKSIIPTSEPGDWSKFEHVLPATLRRFPGLANATQKTTTITDSTEQVISSHTSYRQGVPTAYDMPSTDYSESAKLNLSQMLHATQGAIQQNFNDFWKPVNTTTIKPPVVFLGLLTHRKDANVLGIMGSYLGRFFAEDNTRRTDEKTQAIGAVQLTYPNLHLIDLNIGVNWFRGAVAGAAVDEYIQTMSTFLDTIKSSCPTDSPQDQKYNAAQTILSNLKQHNTTPLMRNRNKNLFTAALCHVMANSVGGTVIVNCKSAKDRTAHELIMADAMEIYFKLHKKWPKYTDTDGDRRNFLAICVEIYKTRHHQKVANDNSPGSMGVKDEHMLDRDLIKALNADKTNPIHAEGKLLASLNKVKRSRVDRAFREIMRLGVTFGYPLVLLWHCLCVRAGYTQHEDKAAKRSHTL